VKPGKIDNSDIILEPPKGSMLKDETKAKSWQNIEMKPDLKEGEDFMIVDSNIWEFLDEEYGYLQNIMRFGIVVNEEA